MSDLKNVVRPFVTGLTGQSGAGKTTVGRVFSQMGFYHIDCDRVARRVVEPDTECFKELSEKFPQFFSHGSFDRKAAAAQLFADRELLCEYNSVILPHIINMVNGEIAAAGRSGERFVLLDAPTLFEAGANALCDCIVACVADTELRLRRIIQRDGITKEQALARFSAQKNESFFRENSDHVIENNGTESELERRAAQVAEIIKSKEKYKDKE